MSCTHLLAVTCILLAAPAAANRKTAATDGSAFERPERFDRPSIRTTDGRLRRLVDDGVRSSETFRTLVERLARSDVVVYLECDGDTLGNVAGRLTFVSAVGGHRYVVIRLRRIMPRPQQLAIMAHELRHAVEIADAPTVVDDASLAREYRRIGHVTHWSTARGITFDSDAAIQTGNRVLKEMSGMSGD